MAVVRTLQARVETDGVAGFTTAMGNARGALVDMSAAAGVAGGALAALGAAGFAVAINEARKFQDAMVEVEKVTNPKTAREMSDSIMELSEVIPLAQDELAAIAADAGRFGVEGTENIEKFTEATAKMATATDLNTTEAGEAFAKLSELTGTPIPEVENLGSSINALSNNFATSAQEIVDSMLRSAGAMSQFGLSQTEIAGFSAALNSVSESSERAGTRLRRLTQEIMNPKKTADLASALNLSVEEFQALKKNDPADLLRTMAQLMKADGRAADELRKTLSTTSRQALAGLGQNIDGLNEALGLSNDAFEENTSLQKEFDAAAKTLNSRLQVTLNRLRNVAISMGQDLIPAATKVVNGINDMIGSFQKLNQRFDGVVAPAFLAATAITGVGLAVLFLNGVLTTGAILAFGIAFAKIIAVIAVLTAAISGLAIAWQNNFLGIRDITMQVVNFVRGAFNSFASFMTKIWNNNIIPLANATKRTFGRIRQNINEALTFVQNQIIAPILGWMRQQWSQHGTEVMSEVRKTTQFWRTQFNKAVAWIREALGPFIKWAKGAWGTFMSFLSSNTDEALAFLRSLWDKHGSTIKSVVMFYFDSIKGFVEFWLDALKTLFVTILRALRGDWDGAWQAIEDFLMRTLDGIISFARTWGGKFLSWLGGLVDDAIQWFKDFASDVIGNSIIPNMLSDVLQAIRGWDLPGAIRNKADDAVDKLRSLASDFRNAGEDLIGGFIDGLEDKADSIGGAVGGAMSTARSYLPGSDAEQGALADLTDSGRAFSLTVAEGIEDKQRSVEDAANQVAQKAIIGPDGRPVSTTGDSGGTTKNVYHIDVDVPKGTDVDTAARTIADEMKSIGMND